MTHDNFILLKFIFNFEWGKIFKDPNPAIFKATNSFLSFDLMTPCKSEDFILQESRSNATTSGSELTSISSVNFYQIT